MASFQVYIPGRQGAGTRHLTDVGLGGLLDSRHGPTAVDAYKDTPDGQTGIVFYWVHADAPEHNPQHFGMHPDNRWTKSKNGLFWLGKSEHETITPEALLRKENLGGELLTLDDGQQWRIPVAKRLERKFDLDENGAPILAVKTEYQEFYEQAERNYRVLMQLSPGEDISMPEMWAFAERSLNYNYRITSEVIAWLGLLGEVTMINLLGGSFERDVINQIEAQKKTA